MNDITVHANPSGRAAYSVVPDRDDPIILQLDGKLSSVQDISAVGFTLAPESVVPGRRYPFRMDLPTAAAAINGYVDVLPHSDDGNLRCQFVDLSADELDALHHYVLMRQKEAIRLIRSGHPGASR